MTSKNTRARLCHTIFKKKHLMLEIRVISFILYEKKGLQAYI